MLPEPEHLPQHLHFLALPRKGEKEAITINATTIMTIFAKKATTTTTTKRNTNINAGALQVWRYQKFWLDINLQSRRRLLSLNVPRAMRRKPKQVYVLRHGHLFGDKTDNGICAHLVEPLEGG